jgi:antitoxin MazE
LRLIPAPFGGKAWHLARCSQRCYNMIMVKHLQAVGNSSGIIIDKPILELLRITPETELDVSTDGERLIITPVRADANRKSRMARAQTRTIANHERTFRKLAK